MAKDAAGVLVQRAGKILAVRRRDGSIGLPCGKVERDESTDEAAERECLEETGYKVSSFVDGAYQGEEGGYNVYIFPAIVKEDRQDHELEVLWLTPAELCVGRFAEFNRAVLAYFGVLRAPSPEAVEIVTQLRASLRRSLNWPSVAFSYYINWKGVTRLVICSNEPDDFLFAVECQKYLILVASLEESKQWKEEWGDFFPPHVAIDVTGDQSVDLFNAALRLLSGYEKPKHFFVVGEPMDLPCAYWGGGQ